MFSYWRRFQIFTVLMTRRASGVGTHSITTFEKMDQDLEEGNQEMGNQLPVLLKY